MTAFEKKSLEAPKRVCLRLKECREARGMSMAELASRTRISERYLLALESCRFDDIPFGVIYQKNFIKRYAAALNLSPQDFLDQYLSEELRELPTAPVISLATRKRLPNFPALIRRVTLGVGVGVVIAYLGIQVKQSIEPPALALYSPPNGAVLSLPEVSIHGATAREARVFINNEPVITDGNGEFKEKIYISPGINTIVVSAKRKHGKTTTETRHVILKEAEQVSFNR